MHDDIETLYQRSLPDFVRVSPEGFMVAGRLESSLEVHLQDEQVSRKLWDHGRVLCQSLDGRSSLSSRKPCRACSDQSRCTAQIILYVIAGDLPFRIALNFSSAQNYLGYRRDVLQREQDLRTLLTELTVVSHGTWGEVHFRTVF